MVYYVVFVLMEKRVGKKGGDGRGEGWMVNLLFGRVEECMEWKEGWMPFPPGPTIFNPSKVGRKEGRKE